MPRVQYTADGGTYRVGGYGFDPGDEHDVEGDLADYLADHEDFEVVDSRDDSVGQEDEPPDDSLAPDPSDHSVADLRDELADIGDIDVLAAVYDAEEAGKNRETALEAIQGRINAVQED
ncbi:hypothetical protein [Haloarcula amylovorans]|uniref:hypothetical protein n=1 Tax=Haloarcula amylovorans TaxID=2562280 RepID=UPI001076026C|nr:hypothetical protein [Halomicroarcula amylolytica]